MKINKQIRTVYVYARVGSSQQCAGGISLLEEKIREAIEAEIDMSKYLKERDKQVDDITKIYSLKDRIEKVIDSSKKGGENP